MIKIPFLICCSRYGYGYRRRGISCAIAVIFIVVVVVPLSVALGLRYGAVSADVDNLNQYALTDKVLRDYSNVFCQGLSVQSMSSRPSSNATLYMLSSPPSPSDIERFNFSEPVSLDSEGEYKQWNFYLNERSTVSLNVCYTAANPTAYSYVGFYLIRGDRNFKHWKNDEVSSSYSVLYRSLTSSCQTINYTVYKSDRFYFIFYSDIYEYATLRVDFQFKRYVYHVNPSDVVENCTIPLDVSSSCSVDVPLSASYIALLSLNTSLPVDYGDEGDVYIDCQPRIWMYAVIAVCVVVGAAAILTCFIVCVCVLVKRNKKKYMPLQGGGEGTEEGATPPTVNVTAGDAVGKPPPYNPQYPAATGGGYGAVSAAPGSTQYTSVYTQ